MAILRSLLVTLGMNSAQYRSDLEKSKKKTQTDYKAMTKASADFALKSAAGFTAAAVTMASANAKLVREQSNAAEMAGMTLSEYQKLTFAAEQYSLTAEQLTAISADSLEKLGEYINAGTGGLQDFADAMGMTKDETLAWAKSMQGLSGQEVLQRMVTDMEDVGLSSEQMRNALEALGSDATRLIPLLKNNGEELDRLTEKYEKFNDELSDDEIAQYRQAAEDIDLLTTSIQQMLSLALVPVLEKIYETGKAWQWLMNSMNAGTIEQITSEMADLADANKELRTEIAYLSNRGYDNFFQDDAAAAAELTKELDGNIERYNELQRKLISMQGLDTVGLTGTLPPVEIEVIPKIKQTKPKKTAFESELDPDKSFDDIYGGTNTVDLFELNLAKKNQAMSESMAEQLEMQNETLEEQYDRDLEFMQENLTDYDEFLTAKANLDKRYSQQKQAAEMASMQAVLSATASFSNAMLGIMDKESEGYKAMFLVSQAAAFANAMVAANLAYAQVLAHDAGILGMGAVASAEVVRGLGYASAAMIAGQSIAGVFHAGTEAIPDAATRKDSSILIEGGERVISKNHNQELMEIMRNKGSQGGGGTVVNVNVSGNINGDKETQRIISQAAQQGYMMVAQDAKTNGTVYKQMRR